jgi:hypothetical protein
LNGSTFGDCFFWDFFFRRQVMSDATEVPKQEAAKWPAAEGPGTGIAAPVTQAALANAAARAAASNSRRDLVEYLRLRRKAN